MTNKNDTQKFIEDYISTVIKHMDVKPSVEVTSLEEGYVAKITGDDLNFLIGYRGDSLEGLQHMLNMAAFSKFGEWQDIMVDINGYRDSRKEKIEEMAKSFIDRARFFSKEVDLPPMSSFERKQVHEFVGEYDDVTSFSMGEGQYRHVVIKPAE
jgi:spoIIIJ-associated protein